MSTPTQLAPPSFSDEEIFAIALRPPEEIAAWAISTAREMGIAETQRPNREFVRAVSRLSDGVVDLDSVEELLIALCRAGVLTQLQQSVLQFHYLLASLPLPSVDAEADK